MNIKLTKGLKKGFTQMPDEKYFKIRCFSNSLAKVLHEKTELHALHWLNDDEPVGKVKQANFDFGTAAHLMVFQPEEFDRLVVEDNPANKNSKIYKEWRADVPAGRLVLSAVNIDKIHAMRLALEKKKSVMDILGAKGYAERAGFFRDPATGCWVKMKTDWIFESNEGMAVCDYKTAEPRALADFEKQAGNLNYHFQAHLYTWGAEIITGVEHKDFFWIVQEKEPPFECRVFVADESMILKAKEEMRDVLMRWANCIATGEWEGYVDVINYLYLPKWRMGIQN